MTQGDDREEALAPAADLLETMVANHMAEGWDLPEPSPARGQPLVAAKAEVYRAMRQAGIDKTELAWRLGIAAKDVDRLFIIHHRTRLDRIEAALAALGAPVGCARRNNLIGTTLPIRVRPHHAGLPRGGRARRVPRSHRRGP
jgi:antitoxin HicB